ncbi:MAG: hypothetical protein NTX50_02545 [Candidatus Sumerlaeota bacterium]|nr:hypothetical protein [Candidatus Sumerlaeota bacterium]
MAQIVHTDVTQLGQFAGAAKFALQIIQRNVKDMIRRSAAFHAFEEILQCSVQGNKSRFGSPPSCGFFSGDQAHKPSAHIYVAPAHCQRFASASACIQQEQHKRIKPTRRCNLRFVIALVFAFDFYPRAIPAYFQKLGDFFMCQPTPNWRARVRSILDSDQRIV